MKRAAITLFLLSARPALAQPTTHVTGCPFDATSLAAAIALEDQAAGRPSAGTVDVTCAPDSTATVRTPLHTRTVDLADVPPSLAPRVIALVAVTLLHEPPPAPPQPQPQPQPETEPEPETETETETEPETETETETETEPEPESESESRPSLLSGAPLSRSAPRSVSARVLARLHDSTSPLFGVSLSLASGPVSLGLSAATSRIDHALGTLTPYLLAARANVALLCASSTCVALDGELGRISVHASASDPMSVSSRSLAAMYAHAAVELSLSGRLADLDVTVLAALGTSRGVIARVDTEAAAVLAGWTLGAGIEVRR